MMAEYIKREAVKKLFFIKRNEWRQHWIEQRIEQLEKRRSTADYYTAEQAVDNWLRGYDEAVDDFLAICDSQPTADVEEVRHGEWEQTTEPLGWSDVNCIECSACGESWIMGEELCVDDYKDGWKYCPNCGAKMDRGADNAAD